MIHYDMSSSLFLIIMHRARSPRYEQKLREYHNNQFVFPPLNQLCLRRHPSITFSYQQLSATRHRTSLSHRERLEAPPYATLSSGFGDRKNMHRSRFYGNFLPAQAGTFRKQGFQASTTPNFRTFPPSVLTREADVTPSFPEDGEASRRYQGTLWSTI